jgi:hypothetical protein
MFGRLGWKTKARPYIYSTTAPRSSQMPTALIATMTARKISTCRTVRHSRPALIWSSLCRLDTSWLQRGPLRKSRQNSIGQRISALSEAPTSAGEPGHPCTTHPLDTWFSLFPLRQLDARGFREQSVSVAELADSGWTPRNPAGRRTHPGQSVRERSRRCGW